MTMNTDFILTRLYCLMHILSITADFDDSAYVEKVTSHPYLRFLVVRSRTYCHCDRIASGYYPFRFQGRGQYKIIT